VTLALENIRAAAWAGRIKWRRHALRRAYQRGITRRQALRVLRAGEIIEQRPRAKPFLAEHAASLVDKVLPRVPVRPWVLTLPYRLRYRLATVARLAVHDGSPS
jgi:hypothetical protein